MKKSKKKELIKEAKSIIKEADERYGNAFKHYRDAFIRGAMWYKNEFKK